MKWKPKTLNQEATRKKSMTESSNLKMSTSAATVDWRQELKNKERAKQRQQLNESAIGTPDYAEPPKPKVLNWREDLKKYEQPASALDRWKSAEGGLVLKKAKPPPSKPKEKQQEKIEPCTCNLGTCKQHPKFALKSAHSKKNESATGLKRSNTTLTSKKEESKAAKPRSSSVKPESKPKKYITKIINFVAIKIAVEDDEKRKRDDAFRKGIEKEEKAKAKSIEKKVEDKPPCKPSTPKKDKTPLKEATPPPPPKIEATKPVIPKAKTPVKKSTPSPKLIPKSPKCKPKPVPVEVKKPPVRKSSNIASRIFNAVTSPKSKRKIKQESPPKTVIKPIKQDEEVKVNPFKYTAYQSNVVTDTMFFGNRLEPKFILYISIFYCIAILLH